MRISKTALINTFIFSALFMIFAVQAFAELKIGYVRPRFIFENYAPYNDAQRKLQEYEKSEADKLQKRKDAFQKSYEDAQNKALLMSEEMIAKTREELAKQKDALDKAVDELYKQGGVLDKKQEELVSPIIATINNVLAKVGKANGYDYILDAEQGVLFADDKHDISNLVIDELKKGSTTAK
jgi:outer membrane protein